VQDKIAHARLGLNVKNVNVGSHNHFNIDFGIRAAVIDWSWSKAFARGAADHNIFVLFIDMVYRYNIQARCEVLYKF